MTSHTANNPTTLPETEERRAEAAATKQTFSDSLCRPLGSLRALDARFPPFGITNVRPYDVEGALPEQRAVELIEGDEQRNSIEDALPRQFSPEENFSPCHYLIVPEDVAATGPRLHDEPQGDGDSARGGLSFTYFTVEREWNFEGADTLQNQTCRVSIPLPAGFQRLNLARNPPMLSRRKKAEVETVHGRENDYLHGGGGKVVFKKDGKPQNFQRALGKEQKVWEKPGGAMFFNEASKVLTFDIRVTDEDDGVYVKYTPCQFALKQRVANAGTKNPGRLTLSSSFECGCMEHVDITEAADGERHDVEIRMGAHQDLLLKYLQVENTEVARARDADATMVNGNDNDDVASTSDSSGNDEQVRLSEANLKKMAKGFNPNSRGKIPGVILPARENDSDEDTDKADSTGHNEERPLLYYTTGLSWFFFTIRWSGEKPLLCKFVIQCPPYFRDLQRSFDRTHVRAPVIKPVKQKKVEGQWEPVQHSRQYNDWRRVADGSALAGSERYEFDNEAKQLVFTVTLSAGGECMSIAKHLPYSVRDLEFDMKRWMHTESGEKMQNGRADATKQLMRQEVIGESIGKFPLHAFTVGEKVSQLPLLTEVMNGQRKFLDSEPFGDEHLHGRKLVFFSARVHAGESSASHMLVGILDFLVSDTELAKEWRRRFVAIVVPMLNADGVAYGSPRRSPEGFDPNRVWDAPHRLLHPTIVATKELFLAIDRHLLFAYFDLHGHSNRTGIMLWRRNGVKPATPVSHFITASKHILGPKFFNEEGCDFMRGVQEGGSPCRGTASGVFAAINWGDQNGNLCTPSDNYSFTIEASVSGITAKQYQFCGKALLEAMLATNSSQVAGRQH